MHVVIAGTVTGTPHRFFGARTHADHESFPIRTPGGAAVEIVANLHFAPWVAVAAGDRVVVGGELVRGARGDAVLHWTHHDPAGRHAPGFIEWNGRRYA